MADMFEPLKEVECQTNQPRGFSLLRQTQHETKRSDGSIIVDLLANHNPGSVCDGVGLARFESFLTLPHQSTKSYHLPPNPRNAMLPTSLNAISSASTLKSPAARSPSQLHSNSYAAPEYQERAT
jgi:hypothetical protein